MRQESKRKMDRTPLIPKLSLAYESVFLFAYGAG